MSKVRRDLYRLAQEWEAKARRDRRDHYPYQSILDEVLFHADLRFHEYIQYQQEGEFPIRLKKWLDNVSSRRDKQTLFKTVQFITFVDLLQMRSLYRDVYRRIIAPWVASIELTREDLFRADYEAKIHSILKQYFLFSITESFSFPEFLRVNNLAGLPKPRILGEDKKKISVLLPKRDSNLKGLIIFEDFVGTGKQAQRVLLEIKANTPSNWRILFVPLIILARGLSKLNKSLKLKAVAIRPGLIVSNTACLQKRAVKGEQKEFKYLRSIVKSTGWRVLRPVGPLDDPPTDAFGYGGSGALLVTCHNTPNNTLPMIHHRSPEWSPLFRRLHHSKDGLR